MAENNYSVTNEFILVGFSDHPDLNTLLFLVFFVIYLVTMVGNLGLVVLIYMEHRLHTPMYIFLGNLALMDSCCSCAITPKMLQNFFSVDRRISLYECMVQFYLLCLAETADCFLLAAMAYDRYVAICNPLQYHTMMSKKLCLQMTVGAYIAGNLHSMIHIGFLFRLTFCRSHVIKHFFCDFLPLYRLSCVDPYLNELMILIFAGLIQVFTITVVLVSYLYVLFTIFTMKSKDGRGKTLSTCASHFLSVSIFYGSLLYMYVQPHSFNEGDKDIPVAIFYTVIIPLLNPFIYSLRNKEVINVMKRIMKRFFSNIRKQGPSPLEKRYKAENALF
ncbi:olfactory receptor 5K1-like [Cricetulus griseus]|uniref:Olfactory receptor n=1 Tax=Cricetulus griseus TaxID=10029 RepID=A0A9J7JLA4_CRIGR|nr:olfactory receptor 5K1-like [Cricetulus griseus]